MGWLRRCRRRNKESAATPARPKEELWHSLRFFFEDDESSHAGDDVGFDDLAAEDVERLWDCLRSRAASVGSEPSICDKNNEAIVDPPELAEAVRLLVQGHEIGYVKASLDGVESSGAVLPQLWVELWPDAVSMYWWVGDPWDEWAAAALAELLGELRSLAPHARLAFEHPELADAVWGPVERYLATT